MNNELSTGDVARACGVSPDTIRYYERCGAFGARRLANGYRRFPPETVQRVHVIRRAIAIGFSMEEIVRFFSERRAGRPPCRQVRAAAEAKLEDIDRRIAEMVALRGKLTAILAEWDIRLANGSEGEPAHLLENLASSIIPSRARDTLRVGDPSPSKPALSERSESNGRLRIKEKEIS